VTAAWGSSIQSSSVDGEAGIVVSGPLISGQILLRGNLIFVTSSHQRNFLGQELESKAATWGSRRSMSVTQPRFVKAVSTRESIQLVDGHGQRYPLATRGGCPNATTGLPSFTNSPIVSASDGRDNFGIILITSSIQLKLTPSNQHRRLCDEGIVTTATQLAGYRKAYFVAILGYP
jgi:hypothetical protein